MKLFRIAPGQKRKRHGAEPKITWEPTQQYLRLFCFVALLIITGKSFIFVQMTM